MNMQFEYLVCRVNFQRVTFVNEAWQGKDVPESERKDDIIESCPAVWEYLQRAGSEGWELVSAVDSSIATPKASATLFKPADQVPYQLLFLKRQVGQ